MHVQSRKEAKSVCNNADGVRRKGGREAGVMRHDFGPAALLPSAFGALEAVILIYRCVGAPSSCAISQLGERRRTYTFRAMPSP